VNIRSAGKSIGATAGSKRLPMARAPPIFPHAETSACPAVGQLGNRLDDLFGQRARTFCRYLHHNGGDRAGWRPFSADFHHSHSHEPPDAIRCNVGQRSTPRICIIILGLPRARRAIIPSPLWVYLWLGAPFGDCAFSISKRHKLNNALMMTATIGPLELAGLVSTYASTCRTRSVSVEVARHRCKAVLTG
jgi:hypothetical protein